MSHANLGDPATLAQLGGNAALDMSAPMAPEGTIVDAALLPPSIDFTKADRQTLRELAAEVAALAALPIEAEKQELWRRHNQLEHTRPVIYCSPENAWTEILPAEQLRCTDPMARDWERRLRQDIFYGRYMGDDYTIPTHFDIGHVHEDPFWGLAERRVGADHNMAYTWVSPIESPPTSRSCTCLSSA